MSEKRARPQGEPPERRTQSIDQLQAERHQLTEQWRILRAELMTLLEDRSKTLEAYRDTLQDSMARQDEIIGSHTRLEDDLVDTIRSMSIPTGSATLNQGVPTDKRRNHEDYRLVFFRFQQEVSKRREQLAGLADFLLSLLRQGKTNEAIEFVDDDLRFVINLLTAGMQQFLEELDDTPRA